MRRGKKTRRPAKGGSKKYQESGVGEERTQKIREELTKKERNLSKGTQGIVWGGRREKLGGKSKSKCFLPRESYQTILHNKKKKNGKKRSHRRVEIEVGKKTSGRKKQTNSKAHNTSMCR